MRPIAAIRTAHGVPRADFLVSAGAEHLTSRGVKTPRDFRSGDRVFSRRWDARWPVGELPDSEYRKLPDGGSRSSQFRGFISAAPPCGGRNRPRVTGWNGVRGNGLGALSRVSIRPDA